METVLELVDADMEQWQCHSVWKTMPGTLSTNSWRMVRERPSGRLTGGTKSVAATREEVK